MTKIKNFFKGHKKLILILAVIAVGAVGAKSLFFKAEDGLQITKTDAILLEKKDFEIVVSEIGEAVSEDSAMVYAEKQLPVKEINVEVGDEVQRDQVIAKLDDSMIKQQIALKQAMIASNNKSASAQIKSAKDKLKDANKNLEEGTNSTLIAANNAVISAYDQWQSAEKSYDDYRRSLNMGYNDQLLQQDSLAETAQDSLKATQLNYNQSLEKYNSLQRSISDNSANLRNANMRVDSLKDREAALNSRINELTSRVEGAGAFKDVSALEQQLLDIDLKLNSIDRTAPGADSLVSNLESRRKEIWDQINMNSNEDSFAGVETELESLKQQLRDVQENLLSVQGDVTKYEAEIETAKKQLESGQMEIEQQSLALEKAKKDLKEVDEQRQKSDLTRKDQLETYRKNAEDLKSAYEGALRNLDVAEAAVKAEINALKSNVSLADAGSDNSVNSVDLKNLYEDLEKTVVKAPISGTVTEQNMIKGQVPANYMAKIDTVDRIIVKSKAKEFDINNLKVGMTADITSDAIGKTKVFKGRVESINPTPVQGMNEGPSASKEVFYEVKLTIEDRDNLIKPGMTLRVKYIFERQKDVLTVPLNAIYQKKDKDFLLYVEDSKGSVEIKEMPVTVKSSNDYEAVISSKEKLEGIRVITSPDKFTAGTKVTFVEEEMTDE
ncbi:MAG: HlyD family efflux transporter periplasmic adaptor subunit [Peptoniphilus sp.]|nr:HlyD family efflux transporter periplasmic adaptor subunit [Peptoniphilus sp.]